ncbi:MAG: autotransporter outer membrane beta-barrel domain-containing protein [Rhizomicrobium sp.]
MDGTNTAASAYYGTVNVEANATFMVGDATHTSAIFGDVSGSATKIYVYQSGGSMGVLSGFGTIYGSVTNTGIVRPGTTGTAGTLTIHGDYTQNPKGELSVQVTPTGASKLVVSGAATLDGTLVVNVASGTYSNAVYQIVSAGSVSGSFSSVSYVGSDTSAIIGLEQTTTGYSLVTEKASAAQSFGHAVSSNRALVASFTRTLYDQIEANLPAAGGTAAAADGEIRVWAAPFGRIDDVGKDDAGYDVQYGGLVGGGEYHFPAMNAVVGGAFSYAHGSMNIKKEDSDSTSNTFNLAIYGGADLELGRVDAVAFYNLYDVSMKRNMGDYGTAKASPSGWSYGGSFQISQNIFDNLLSPYIRSTYSRNHIDGVTEHGADEFALNYSAINQNAFVGDIGFKIHAITPTPQLKAKLEFTVGVAHDFSTTRETVEGQFANIDGSSFTYTWRGNNANSLLVGAEFADEVVAGIEVYGRLNGQFTANERAVELSVGGRYKF